MFSDVKGIIKERNELPDEEVHGARSRRISSAGASVSVGLGQSPL